MPGRGVFLVVALSLLVAGGSPLGATVAATPADRGQASAVGPVVPGHVVGSTDPGRGNGRAAARPVGGQGRTATPGNSATPEDRIHVRYYVSRVPDEPGVVEVRATVSLPDRVNRFEFGPPPNATAVVGTDGFERGGEYKEFRWDGGTATPSIVYRLPVNETTALGMTYADAAEWTLIDGIFVTGRFRYWWSTGTDPGWDRSYHVGRGAEGYAGSVLVFLGEHEVHENRSGGATYRLVYPDAVEEGASPEAVFAVLDEANAYFGRRNGTVTVFVAPSPITVGETPVTGGNESTIPADAEDPIRFVLHEYVHTRQTYRPPREFSWIDEATAEYFMYLLALQNGRVDYEEFEAAVIGVDSETDLSRRSTWSSPEVEYDKGSSVVAAIDVLIRRATGGNRTFRDAFRRMVAEENLTYAEFKGIVSEVAGKPLGDRIDALVYGDPDSEVDPSPYLFVRRPGADPDGDGLPTRRERSLDTNPFLRDSDVDGAGDGEEVEAGTDPDDYDDSPGLAQPTGLPLALAALFALGIYWRAREFRGE